MMQYQDVIRRNSGPPVNIEAIIRDLGIDLQKNADLPNQISGQLERLGVARYRISTKKGDHYFRQRFTMAHELGHYMLHAHLIGHGVNDSLAFRSDPSGDFYNPNIGAGEETEANRFAAEMLMPKELLAVPTTFGLSVAKLATDFQVSPKAMEIRLRGLGFAVDANGVVTAANP